MCKVFEQVACGFLEDQWAPSVCARDRAWVRSLRPKPEQWRRRGGEYSGEERGGGCSASSGEGGRGGSEFRAIEEIYVLAYGTLKVCWMTIVAIKKRSAICICEPSERRRFCPGLYIGTVFYTKWSTLRGGGIQYLIMRMF